MPTKLMWDDIYAPPNDSPDLVVLSYSGGAQSHAIARMLLRGELAMPERLLVVAADPGNEHRDTYRFRDATFEEFRSRGIPAIVSPGPKMLEDLRERILAGRTSIDQPALWTDSGGQLRQHCTRHYKIRPMNRAVWKWWRENMPPGRIADNAVERWIGFAFDEMHRFKKLNKHEDRRQQFRCPLIDMQWTCARIETWYAETGEEMPPRSVCNHCWANGADTFRRIRDTDPEGWAKAVEYDELSRDMSQFGVREKCYCFRGLVPLRLLGDDSAEPADVPAWQSCDSGACFI